MLSVMLLLAIAAFMTTIASAIGKCPLWVAVLLLCLVALVQVLPLR